MAYFEKQLASAQISEYSYLWTAEKADWILIGSKHDYVIFNTKTQMMLLMEDEQLNQALADKMLEQGNRVYQSIPESEQAYCWQDSWCNACQKGFCAAIHESWEYQIKGKVRIYRKVTCPSCQRSYYVVKGDQSKAGIPEEAIPEADVTPLAMRLD